MTTIILNRTLDLSPKDATHVAKTLGYTNFRFLRLPGRSARTIGTAPSRQRAASGGRYLARLREA